VSTKLISSYAGKDKWEKLHKDKLLFVISHIQLEKASQYVNFQLPTEHSRVGYLIFYNIRNTDPDHIGVLQF